VFPAFHPDEAMVSMQHKVMIQFDHFVPWNKATPLTQVRLIKPLDALEQEPTSHWERTNLTSNKQFQQTTMESFNQEHVVGIPLSSLRYADERKPTCSTLACKKGNDLTIFFPVSLCSTYSDVSVNTDFYPFLGADKKNSIIYRLSKLSQKTDSYMQGFKEHCKYAL
jgi:hypothetical protein